jgi:hypothetical protein
LFCDKIPKESYVKRKIRDRDLHWFKWLVAWAEIFDGVAGVLSLGYWRPALAFKVTLWYSLKIARQMKEESSG